LEPWDHDAVLVRGIEESASSSPIIVTSQAGTFRKRWESLLSIAFKGLLRSSSGAAAADFKRPLFDSAKPTMKGFLTMQERAEWHTCLLLLTGIVTSILYGHKVRALSQSDP
jgi:hypothetical protein